MSVLDGDNRLLDKGLPGGLLVGQERLRTYQRELQRVMGPVLYNAIMDTKVSEIRANSNGALILKLHGQPGSILKPPGVSADDRRAICSAVLSIHNAKDIVGRQLFDYELPFDGSRMSITGPPTADEWEFTIRKKMILRRSFPDYVDAGSMSLGVSYAIMEAIEQRKTIAVSGGTGSGKTVLLQTFLDYLVALISPGLMQRLIIIEHVRELICEYADAVRWRTDYGTSMLDLSHHAMRNSPDRIISGELKDGSALDYFRMITTGHPGALFSVHANSASHCLTRCCDLAQERQLFSANTLVSEAIDFVVHIQALPDNSRRVTLISVAGPGRAPGTFAVEPISNPSSSYVVRAA